jgi:DNA mismatch repair protein MutS
MADRAMTRRGKGRRTETADLEDASPPEGAPEVTAPPAGEGSLAADDEAVQAAATAITPSMAQFIEIKAANPDCLLFYRMGDFYELFFEDAVAASRALGITLTKRGKHLGEDIPMCGVPIHAADGYLQQLIRRGFRVAVCEQLEDPAEARKRGSKAVVRRDVVRLVTPGTLTEDSLLDARRHNYLSALFELPRGRGGESAGVCYAMASLDISTGAFLVGEVSEADLGSELARLLPSEIIIADAGFGDPRMKAAAGLVSAALTPVPKAYFDSLAGERDLKARFGVSEIGGLGTFSRGELAAIAAVLKYIDLTQIGRKPMLRHPVRTGPQSVMVIDAATRANLELVRTSSGERDGSLIAAIDRTVTGPGARELMSRLTSPLKDPRAIAARLDAVQFLLDEAELRRQLREALKEAADIARALSRLAFGRGGPRDLGAVRQGLAAAGRCRALLEGAGSGLGLPTEIASILGRIGEDVLKLEGTLAAALADELPVHRRDGGFVRAGFRAELDDNRRLRDQSRQVLAELQTRYQEATGVKSLKVKHNNVLGYFIEVTAGNAKALTGEGAGETFRHRQTLANVMRFTTPELSDAEGRITAAGARALAIEQEVFAELAAAVTAADERLAALASALAELDHYAGLAELAEEQGYVRPCLDDSLAFDIRGGRHPVVEQALKAARQGPFIENDCVLGRAAGGAPHDVRPLEPQPEGSHGVPGFDEVSPARIWIVTGPNMAGKSTFLRQNALIAIMAQIGSFVPARSAHIGVVDRLFSRVGASDDLARGRSTFMVEMVETAAILNQAGERSLVILDEIGRGTATFDGLSIAWASVEHLDQVNRCRALFATHYHELTALAGKLPTVANVTIEVKEWQDDIVFLHKVVPGAADRSYGIQVAKLAGLPKAVIARAGEVLRLLEDADTRVSPEKLVEDLPLFAAARPKSHVPVTGPVGAAPADVSPLEAALSAINPDELTPKAALEALYQLKRIAK